MKAAVRCNALTLEQLKAQERHGKRQDQSSKSRRVRTSSPIVGRGLNLCDQLAEHTAGTKQNKGANNVALHFIIKFPNEVLTDAAPKPFQGLSKRDRQKEMAKQATRFIQEVHGGHAVFGVRVDTDEEGECIVDVFACPKYEKTTKSGTTMWTSLTKFGKELARKHQDEVRRRSPDKEHDKEITSPRAIGISLQSEFASFFERVNGQVLDRKTEKNRPGRDRLDTEAWKLKVTQDEQQRTESQAADAIKARDAAHAEASEIIASAEAESRKFRAKANDWVAREKQALSEKHRQADADRAVASMELTKAEEMLSTIKAAYEAVRAAIPRIRRILTWDLATDVEKRQAKIDRKEIVRVSPVLRSVMNHAEQRAKARREDKQSRHDIYLDKQDVTASVPQDVSDNSSMSI